MIFSLICVSLVLIYFKYMFWKDFEIKSPWFVVDIFAGSFFGVFMQTKNIVATINKSDILKRTGISYLTMFHKKITVIGDYDIAMDILQNDYPKIGFTYDLLNKITTPHGNLISTPDHKKDIFYLKYKKICFDDIYRIWLIKKDYLLSVIDKKIIAGRTDFKKLSFSLISFIISIILFDSDNEKAISEAREGFEELISHISKYPYLYMIPGFNNFSANKKINNAINKLMTNRKEDCLLATLQRNNCPDHQIIGCIKLLFFAGYETTANALSWTLYEIVKNNITNLCDDTYLKYVIMETLRIHPIVNTAMRNVTDKTVKNKEGEDVEINGPCMFFTKMIQDEDNKFNPDRFKGSPHWMPFMIGTRQCLGKELSMAEISEIIKIIFNKFNVSVVSDVKEITRITLEPSELIVEFTDKLFDNCTKQSDDYHYYKGEKYDLTQYIDKHPGGSFIIETMKGKDIEEAMQSSGHSANAYRLLEKFKV